MISIQLYLYSTSIKIRNEGGCGDVRSAKMIETRHGLESNPVPTSIFAPKGQ